jgi:hypothetical protein
VSGTVGAIALATDSAGKLSCGELPGIIGEMGFHDTELEGCNYYRTRRFRFSLATLGLAIAVLCAFLAALRAIPLSDMVTAVVVGIVFVSIVAVPIFIVACIVCLLFGREQQPKDGSKGCKIDRPK